MTRTTTLLLILASTGSLTACGTARVVQRNPGGGTLALQGVREEAMKDAHVKMSSHCGPGQYSVVQESEQVVGTQTVNSEEAKKTKKGTVVNEGQSQTRDVTEWRITYQCGAPGMAAMQPGYPAQPPPGYPPPQPGYAPPPGYPPPAGYAPPPQGQQQQPYPPPPPQGQQPQGYAPAPPQGYPPAPPQGYPPPPPQGQQPPPYPPQAPQAGYPVPPQPAPPARR